MTKPGFTSFQIKIIALVCMTVDHIAAYALAGAAVLYEPMRVTGRIAAPLFLFLVVQGARHTRNKAKYILRLYLAGAVVQALNTLLDPGRAAGFSNMLPTLMYTALFIVAIEATISAVKTRKWKDLWLPVLGIIVPAALSIVYLGLDSHGIARPLFKIFAPPIFYLEYSFLFVLLGIAWYFIDRPIYNCALLAALSAVCGLVDLNAMLRFTAVLPFNFFQLFIGTQWCMVLAIPFILLYNGGKGRGGKYFFYVYYPLHQYIIYALASVAG